MCQVFAQRVTYMKNPPFDSPVWGLLRLTPFADVISIVSLIRGELTEQMSTTAAGYHSDSTVLLGSLILVGKERNYNFY